MMMMTTPIDKFCVNFVFSSFAFRPVASAVYNPQLVLYTIYIFYILFWSVGLIMRFKIKTRMINVRRQKVDQRADQLLPHVTNI